MLVREGQSLDLQEFRFPEYPVDINTQGMGGQFRNQTGTQAPKGVGMIDLNGELFRELTIDGFNHLADGIKQSASRFRDLFFLIAPGQALQPQAIVASQLGGLRRTDVTFIAQHGQIGMLAQELKADVQISEIGRSQFEIQNQTAQGDQ